MSGLTKLGCRRFLLLFCIVTILILTVAASIRFSTPIPGLPVVETGQMDSGWSYRREGGLTALEQLPCSVDMPGGSLELIHSLTGFKWDDEDVLAFQTRYESIGVWADEELIYEAAQGKEHALSSMWHFIPLKLCKGASQLRVELNRYEQGTSWIIPAVLKDHPGAIWMHLLHTHIPAILFWFFCSPCCCCL